jgi:Rrf2 family protein
MKISTKGRYALRMLLDLAQHQGNGYIALKDIAARQNISKKYLEQIVITLNQGGLLLSNRGFQGGYRLAKDPKDITIYQILEATEDSMAPVSCLQGENTCPRRFYCDTLPVWEGLYKVVREYLEGITLQDLLDQSMANGADNYMI